MKPDINRLVSSDGIRWNIYHVMPESLEILLLRNTPFWPKMCVKMTICTSNVRKTPKTHMKPDISRLVSICVIHWNIYHILLVKFRNYMPT